jgi:hypothetical protein
MPDKQQWRFLDKVFAEVFSRPMPETDSEALRFILMEVQSLTRVRTKRTNELLTEILDELREIRSSLTANLASAAGAASCDLTAISRSHCSDPR